MGNWQNKYGLFDWSDPQLAPTDAALDRSIAEGIVEARIWPVSNAALVGMFAVAAFAIHFLIANRYGYFRDELYYAACGHAPCLGLCRSGSADRVDRLVFAPASRGFALFLALFPGAFRCRQNSC